MTDSNGTLTDRFAYASSADRVSTLTNASNTRTFSYLPSGQVSEDVRSAASD